MIRNGRGGANTNKTGLSFENYFQFKETLENVGFILKITTFKNIFKIVDKYDKELGYMGEQPNSKFYDFFDDYLSIKLDEKIDLQADIDVRLFPDKFYFDTVEQILYIIECKTQTVSGSTDEKIQTAPFKKYFYSQLLLKYNIKIEFIYVWNEWFNHKRYGLVKEFLNQNNVKYFLDEIPLADLGLVISNNED
ncbi:hypothetical protein [Spiroplasma endosymbiont of Dilophus febrilis]|uniref:hypothetical protein n=2 Tax=Spiroplasma TaxID=2132 RepID=UPI00313AE747